MDGRRLPVKRRLAAGLAILIAGVAVPLVVDMKRPPPQGAAGPQPGDRHVYDFHYETSGSTAAATLTGDDLKNGRAPAAGWMAVSSRYDGQLELVVTRANSTGLE